MEVKKTTNGEDDDRLLGEEILVQTGWLVRLAHIAPDIRTYTQLSYHRQRSRPS